MTKIFPTFPGTWATEVQMMLILIPSLAQSQSKAWQVNMGTQV